ncbi:DUF2878 domain-containing protein [Exilibacterium tricleocarpae]|uniref:DUF2878 domain-containing protein n=1 Tax=Exilibacterium tricleocarpae TaxID=2591008 RepID=UPI0015D339D4|nr:DUF2878 domain-containing protein [Exilibacterium tricleocarpae]
MTALAQRLQTRVKNSELGRLVLNAALFEVVWFACVWGGDGMAAAAVIALLAVHGWLVMRDTAEWRFIAAVALVGIAGDCLWFGFGVFQRTDQMLLPPLWLMLLWLAFATTLKHSFAKLGNFWWLAALVGAVAGPLSYLAGAALNGGVEFAQPLWLSFAALAVYWAVLLPGLLYWGRKTGTV